MNDMSNPPDNMNLWNSVCETNPAITKKVNQRGGFTAIDAYGQIEMATKQFGPVGQGWGWSVENTIFPPNGTVIVEIKMWHGNRENNFPVFGQKSLAFGSKPDEDALKKALTDAVTKGLSYLGFNADVFLGKFDDNKYVQDMAKKHEGKQEPITPHNPEDKPVDKKNWRGPLKITALKDSLRDLCNQLREVTENDTLEFVQGLWLDYDDMLKQAKHDLPDWYDEAEKVKNIAKGLVK